MYVSMYVYICMCSYVYMYYRYAYAYSYICIWSVYGEQRKRMRVKESLEWIWLLTFLTGSSISPHRRVWIPNFSAYLGWWVHFPWDGCLPVATHQQPSVLSTKQRSSIPHVRLPMISGPTVPGEQRLCLPYSLSNL